MPVDPPLRRDVDPPVDAGARAEATVPADEVPGSKVEQAKARSRQLRSTIADELRNAEATFSSDAALTLKFHGTYSQDDRDTRRARRSAGRAPDAFQMVRTGVPGGVLSSQQYLAMDKLADSVGNGTLRVTTRQDIQFHRVYKHDLPELIRTLNEHLVTTLAACGDVVRNTTACPAPLPGGARSELVGWAQRVSAAFKPRSGGYYDIWVDGERAVSASHGSVGPATGTPREEPLYGRVYLPRKFKIGFCAPGDNCTDVLINDLAVVPIVEHDTIRAFSLLVGGGQGKSHNRPETYPRLASPLTTVPPDELLAACQAVIELHRDHGDRTNREHARLKYVVDDLGDDQVRELVAGYLGRTRLREYEPVVLDHAEDHLGWHAQGDGAWFLGVKVANGRIADAGDVQVRSGLRTVVERFGASVRFTAREDVLLCDVAARDRGRVDDLLGAHGVRPADRWAPVERSSFACPSLPTCGLALAESERALPGVLEELHGLLAGVGLADLELHVRMTGCPNGCARPYTTEVALVGRGKDRYDIHLGGEQVGARLNEVFCENVPRRELLATLRPVVERYAATRGPDERFGDWCHAVGVAELRAALGTEQWVRSGRGQPRK